MAAERKKVLVVDDEQVLRDTLDYNLRREGYQALLAADGIEALRVAQRTRPDLVLLDLMMPGMDGLEVCRALRREVETPILILTAKDDEFEKVLGLEIGADDYITKPFSMRELMARVKAHLRRSEKARHTHHAKEAPSAERIVRGEIEIVPAKHQVRLCGETVGMKPKEYDLLLLLASHPGVVFTRDILLERVWHFDYPGGITRTVDVHVNWLRKKLEVDPANPRYIQT